MIEISSDQILVIIGALSSVIVTLAAGIATLWRNCTAAEKEWRSEVINLLKQLLVIANPNRDREE